MKNILVEYIIKNKRNFILIIALFFIGIAIGIFFVNNTNDMQKLEINNYINELISNIKNSQDINRADLLIASIKQNVIFIIIIWFLGCTIIGGFLIYIAIIYKGFAIGYTISAIIAVLGIKAGTIVSVVSLFLQNLVFLPAFFLISENRYKSL